MQSTTSQTRDEMSEGPTVPQTAADGDPQRRIRELEQRLAAAQSTIEALSNQEIDGQIEQHSPIPLLPHQAQRSLMESEKKWRAIFYNALDAMVITDDDGVYVEANAAAGELLGLPRQEIVGRRVEDFLTEETDFPDAWRTFHESERERGQIALSRPDGEVRYAEYSAVANFRPGRHLSVMRDVTRRKQMERALLRSEKNYRNLFQHTLNGFALYELTKGHDDKPVDFVYRKVNRAFEELFGRRHQDLVGHCITELHDDFSSELIRRLRHVARTGESVYVEHFSQELGRHLQIAAFRPQPGQIAVLFTDITGRKEAERERTQALHHLSERVKEISLLYRTGHLLSVHRQSLPDLLTTVCDLIPPAWQYPDITAARISYGALEAKSKNFRQTPWCQRTTFQVPGGQAGAIEVVYLQERPQADEGPFLAEERAVLEALANMLQADLERRQAREALEQSEARYRSLFETMAQGVVYHDGEGQIVVANPAAGRILGYPVQKLTGTALEAFRSQTIREDGSPLPVEDYPAMIALRSGQPVHGVVMGVFNPRDDDYRWLVVNAVPRFRPGEEEPYQVYTTFEDITERKRAEERRFQLATIVESSQDAIVGVNLEGVITSWNWGAEKVYGYTAEEAVGRPVTMLAPSERDHEILQHVNDVGMGKSVENKATVRRHKSGRLVPVSLTTSPIRNDRGQIVGSAGISRDVTVQRQHERELEAIAATADELRTAQRSDAIQQVILDQLGSLLQAQSSAILLYDPANDKLDYGQRTGLHRQLESTGLHAGETITGQVIRSGRRFVSSDVGSEPATPFGDHFDGLAGACVPLITGDETIGALWLIRANPFKEPELQILTAIADMAATAIQRAVLLERLETQAALVQRIMDTVDDGLLLLDSAQRVLLANPAAVEHLACLLDSAGRQEAPHDLLGQHIKSLGDRPLTELLAGPPGRERTLVCEAHQRREFEVAAHPVRAEGEAGGWVLVLRDVTEARRSQEIVQQQERLAAVGQLAAGIAHDFNNVMSAIILYAQMLQNHPDLTEKERRRLNVIHSQANHATDLIRQILDFSRRSVMERSPMDLSPFVKEIFKLWERTLPENISLRLRYEDVAYKVHVDPTRLQQALTNLAINARDAMPDGGELTLALSHLTLVQHVQPPVPGMEPGNWIQIKVTDTGEGIPQAAQAHIFEPFFSTKPQGKGTGLGLAQVYGIIRQHDGFLTVNSAPGRGTSFDIYLPGLQENVQNLKETPTDRTVVAVTGTDATILVVEDQEWARVAVEETLQVLGYDVLSAEDGRAALELVQEHGTGIDLVLSDLVMPDLGGLKLYKQIQSAYPGMKMIIMSGYPLEDEGRSLLEQGIVDWIPKPFSVHDLADKIAEVLQGKA